MLAFYNRRIEADPRDAYAYSSRAQYHDRLADRAKATADMRQWSAILSGGSPLDASSKMRRKSRRVIDLPFDCEFVFSAERPANAIPMMSVAFGQKGRCEMRLFGIPMVVASLLGFGILAGVDMPVVRAEFVFGMPVNLKSIIPVIDANYDVINCFSFDGREMYITSYRPYGSANGDLFVLKRASKDEEWGATEDLGPVVNSSVDDGLASISADGLTLYFGSNRPGGHGGSDLYMTTRATRNDPWGAPVNLGPKVNSPRNDHAPCISENGLELYFASVRTGGYGRADTYVAKRATPDSPWGDAVNLGPVVNSVYDEQNGWLSPDGLLLFFEDDPWESIQRPGGYGGSDLWMARRASLSAPWQTPVNLGPAVNSPIIESTPRITRDGSTLYFATAKAVGTHTWEYWQMPIIPIVDFTGDGQVDGKDLLAMVMQLGGNDPLCDIGPYAWGDGVVDAKDLEVLAGYIGQGFQDPTLVAHWAFDETEGDIATDSMDESDGRVMIGATWRPDAGMVGGALELDGVTGSVVTGSVAELGTGPFSVIAWVKGGAPGQILLSHNGTTEWLMANPIDGSLMTKLTSNGQPLSIGTSEAVITDGKWHRIALVWDGADRILYVDGKEVARDPQPDLSVADGKFIIGAGSKAGTGWAGLIDDVRIYSRVVRP
jgi:hypothetical protein